MNKVIKTIGCNDGNLFNDVPKDCSANLKPDDNKLDISQCFNFCSYNGVLYTIDRADFKSGNIIVLYVTLDNVIEYPNKMELLNTREPIKTTITITETKETFDTLLALYMKRK